MLDTNTVVSGLLWDKTPSQLIDAGLQGRVELFTTQCYHGIPIVAAAEALDRIARG